MSKADEFILINTILCFVVVVLFAVAVALTVRVKKRVARCTASVNGTITKYSFIQPFHPVVTYSVNGNSYEVHRRYRGIVETQTPGKTIKSPVSDSGAWISKRGYIHIRKSVVTNYASMAKELWPIGSQMKVYYDPKDPSCAFAEELPHKIPTSALTFGVIGAAFLLVIIFINKVSGTLS